MTKYQKILVTGGMGLIGHNVVNLLKNLEHDVFVVDNFTNYGVIPRPELEYLMQERWSLVKPKHMFCLDILDQSNLDRVFAFYQPDTVIHLASFPRQKVVNVNPQQASRTMSHGLLNLLELSRKYNTNRFVYISSSMVYGDFKDQVREDAVCQPQGQYGIMKLAGELLVKDYHRRGCFDYSIIRPSAVYGPLDVEDRVISKFLLTAMRGGTIRVNGATETLDFTYVDDAAAGIVAAATQAGGQNRTFNITKSHSKTLLEAAELAVQMAGQGTIEIQSRDLDFPSRGALNIDAAREHLGFDPKIDIEQGFEKYYQWLKNSWYWKQQLEK